MSINKKGLKALSIGAALALAITGLTVVPAAAGTGVYGLSDRDQVTIAPESGTEWVVLENDSFSVEADFSNTAEDEGEFLKFLVEDAVADSGDVADISLSADAYTATGSAWENTADVVRITMPVEHNFQEGDVVNVELAGTDADVEVSQAVLTAVTSTSITYDLVGNDDVSNTEEVYVYLSTDTSVVVDGDTGAIVFDTRRDINNAPRVINLSSSDDATRTVKVTAWIDRGTSLSTLNEINSTEFASVTETVTFLNTEDLTAVATYDQPAIGDQGITAYITTTPAINGQESTTDDIEGEFTFQGYTDVDDVDASFNSTTRKYEVTADVSDETEGLAVVAGRYSVTPSLSGTDIGPKVSIVVGARTADDATGSAVESKDLNVYDNETNDVELDIREKTLSVSMSYDVVDEDGNAVGAGKTVRLEVDADEGYPTGLKVNGTSVTTSNKIVTATTNSSGKVVIEVTATAAAAGKGLDIEAIAEGNADTSVSYELDWSAAYFDIYDLNNSETDEWYDADYGTDDDYARSISSKGSYTFNFAYVDQWAQAPATGDYQLNIVTEYLTVSEKNYALSNGRASVTISDDDLAGSSEDYVYVDVEVEKKGTDGVYAEGDLDNESWYLYPHDQTAGLLTMNDSTLDDNIYGDKITAGDARISQADVTYGYSSDEIAGTVTDSLDGSSISGAKVTVSGPSNMLFVDGQRSAFGSITAYADDEGDFAFAAYSNTAQSESVVTVTSLGASKTVKFTINPASETAGDALAIAAPKSIKGGRTLAVTVNLKDEYGNAVNGGDTNASSLSLSYDGPGFVVSDLSNVTELGTDGSYTVRVLLSSGDTGPAVLTATYDSNGTTDDGASTVVLTKSSATWVGPIANASAGAKKGNVVVDVYRAKGKTVKVYVGSTLRATFVADAVNDKFVLKGLKSGARNLKVRLSGTGEDFAGAVTVK